MLVSPTREINSVELQKAALIRVKQRKLIDLNKYKILGSGILEGVILDETEGPVDIFQVVTCDMQCNEEKHIFRLKQDLDLTPDQVFNYYLYRLPKDVDGRRGKAIRVVQPKTETNPGFAYNALLLDYNIRQMSFVIIPSRGPFHRILTARQMYIHHIMFHVYQEPDTQEDYDNVDLGYQCDEIK